MNSRLGLGLFLLMLGSFTTVGAQEVAQANTLQVALGQAKDLNGAKGQFVPMAEASGVPKLAPQFITLPEPEQPQYLAQAKPTTPKTPVKPAEEDEDSVDDLLGEYTVTTKRRRSTERENPQTIYKVDREEIKALGSRTIGDALKLVPGLFSIDSLAGTGSDFSTFVRGLDSKRFVFLIDGRPSVRAADNRSADLGRLPVGNIERIEVVTGGAGLQYSADAIGGVINVITRLPEGPPKLTATINAGSFGYSQYSLDYSGSNGLTNPADKTDLLPGYFAYQVQYERRSALNKYATSFYQEPIGGGTRGVPFDVVPQYDPTNPNPQPRDNTQGVIVPVTLNGETNSLYTFNDYYYGKFLFKPGKEHTVTVSLSQFNSRLGDPLGATNVSGCSLRPPVNYENSSVPRPGGPPNSAYASCVTSNSRNFRGSSGDLAQDNTAINAVWEWKLSELNTLTTQASYGSTFYDFPSGGVRYTNSFYPLTVVNPDTGEETPYPGGLGGQPIIDLTSVSTKLVSDRTLDFQVRYQSQLAENNLLNAGMQFTTQRFTSTPFAGAPGTFVIQNKTFQTTDRETNRLAFYVTEDIQFFDKAIILNAGTRLTSDLSFGTFVTSALGFRYNFGSAKPLEAPFALRATWSQSYKAPGLVQLYGEGLTKSVGNTPYISNLGLKPETGVSYDIGLDAQLTPTSLLRITYFRNDLTNFLQDDVLVTAQCTPSICTGGTNTNVFTTINAKSYLSTGWEFSYTWKVNDQFRFQASHTIVDARPLGDGSAQILNLGQFTTSTPYFIQAGYYDNFQTIDVPFSTSSVSLRYATPGFSAGLIGQFVGLRPRGQYGPYYYPGYSKWDFTFSVPLTPALTFNGGVFNFTNDRAILASNALKIGPGIVSPPTNFRLGLEFSF